MFLRFLAGFAHHEEGKKAILQHKNLFEFTLFVLEELSMSPPNEKDHEQIALLRNALVFLGNASASRTNKIHFLASPM